MKRWMVAALALSAAGIVSGLLIASARGETVEPPIKPEGEHVNEESKCTPLLQAFKGMQLVEVHIHPETLDAKLIYMRMLSKHQAVLFLVAREGCSGPYKIVNASSFDPNPEKCPEGATCL